MSSSVKVERFITREELPDFFRGLADALETGGAGEFVCVDEFSRIKIVVRDQFGQMSLMMKTRAKECDIELSGAESFAPGRKPPYKGLKRRMKSSFRLIFRMLQEGRIPPRQAVESFLADSRLMVTYEGMGDEFYDEYIRSCEEFENAFRAGEVDRMKACVVELASQKGRCHAKYD